MTTRRHISTRERAAIFERAGGVCEFCQGKIMAGESWDVSHTRPLAMGGDDGGDNLTAAHRKCHRAHTSANDAPAIARAKRLEASHRGTKAPSKTPLPGGRGTPWKRKMDGTIVPR